jgi:hypothetical protein
MKKADQAPVASPFASIPQPLPNDVQETVNGDAYATAQDAPSLQTAPCWYETWCMTL